MKDAIQVICNEENVYGLVYGKTYFGITHPRYDGSYEIYEVNGKSIGNYLKTRFKVKENPVITMELKPLPVKNESLPVDNGGDFTHAVTLDGKVVAIFTSENFAHKFESRLNEIFVKNDIKVREIA